MHQVVVGEGIRRPAEQTVGRPGTYTNGVVMILVSNHLLSLPGFCVPDDAVVRINMAWVRAEDALAGAIEKCRPHDVFLDYPSGRTKPPVPAWGLDEAVVAVWKYRPQYFAVSNIESPDGAADIEQNLPEDTVFVPKIETLKGVLCLDSILDAIDTTVIMLDTEDLFTCCGDPDVFLGAVNNVTQVCANHHVEVLRLYGVIFSEA